MTGVGSMTGVSSDVCRLCDRCRLYDVVGSVTGVSSVMHIGSVTGVGVLDGLLYAVGGHDGPLVRKSVEVYNPELNMWVPVADMHLCRRNAGNINMYGRSTSTTWIIKRLDILLT